MTIPIRIIQLRAYEGPNIYGPQPGIVLSLSSPNDQARRLRNAIRDGAQALGMVIAQLDSVAQPHDDGFILEAHFNTDLPRIGHDLCTYIVDGMRAEAVGDTTWDRDEPLAMLQDRCRQATPPVAALQLIVAARQRGLPTLLMPNGRIHVGYGARGWSYDPHTAEAATPPWNQIGRIPITLVTGHDLRSTMVERQASALSAAGFPVRAADGLDFSTTRELLTDPTVEIAVIGLDTTSLIERGLPLDHCEQAIICDMGGPRPSSASDDEEWLRALGIPMLLSSNAAQINLTDPRLHPLIPYAPNGVVNLI